MKKIVVCLFLAISIFSFAGSWHGTYGTLYDAQTFMYNKIREVESKGFKVTSYNYGGSRNSWYCYVHWN
ncbi:MAG: hypothetical protein ACRDCW_03020 [Sarcina sp.]